jgi:hypothetical protein
MAGKNDFRSLKQFGTKELKFKQGVHIEAAYKGNVLSAPVYTSAKRGVCAALTMEWLKAKLSEGKYAGPFNPAPDVPAAKNMMHQAAVWHAAQFQTALKENPDKQQMEYRLAKLAGEYGLDLRGDKNLPDDHFIGVFSKAEDTTARDEGVFCNCNITDERDGRKSAHAIGIVKLDDGIRFFDANVGAYKFENSYKFTKFYELWGQLYRDKLKYHITRCWGYRVRNIPGVTPQIIRQ